MIHIEKELVPINSETLCLSEATEVINKISVKFPSQLLVQEKHISKILASFNKNFEQLSINSRNEVSNFETEPTFENTINEIKANHLKSITSINMNVSSITPKTLSSSYENIKSNLVSCVLLQSPGKIPQFTKHLSSMHPKGKHPTTNLLMVRSS